MNDSEILRVTNSRSIDSLFAFWSGFWGLTTLEGDEKYAPMDGYASEYRFLGIAGGLKGTIFVTAAVVLRVLNKNYIN